MAGNRDGLKEQAEMYEMKDSGARETLESGAKRDTREGKGRFDLIPPEATRRLAVVYEKGAAKYDDDNWRKGFPFTRLLDSTKRHINQYLEGDTTEDHLMQAAWGLFTVASEEEMIRKGELPSGLNDIRAWLRPKEPTEFTVVLPDNSKYGMVRRYDGQVPSSTALALPDSLEMAAVTAASAMRDLETFTGTLTPVVTEAQPSSKLAGLLYALGETQKQPETRYKNFAVDPSWANLPDLTARLRALRGLPRPSRAGVWARKLPGRILSYLKSI